MMLKRRLVLSLAVPVMLAGGIAACQSARRSEPLTSIRPDPPSAELKAGQVAFMRNCHECHPNGAQGLGPALNDKPLPPAAMKLQIRAGVGKMPAFSKEKVSDRDADLIVDYLVWLRRSHPPGKTTT